MTKIFTIVLASLLILAATWHFRQRSGLSGAEASLLQSPFAESCQSKVQRSDFHKLSDGRDATDAVTKLLELAKESAECRDAVINGVIGALKNADLDNDNSAFRLWATGSAILGRLKAVEALDLLISHLNLSDGLFSASMIHEPVVLAMVEMGEVAVPKLSFALKYNPDKKIRLAAAYCLGDIGGSEALAAMKSALNSETEECVRRFITLTLPSPDEPPNSNRPITPQDGELLRQRIFAYRCGN